MSVDITERLRLNEDDWLFGNTAHTAKREIEALRAENASLKVELKAINAALDDPRTDLTMTAYEVIAALKEQVAQLVNTMGRKSRSER